MKGEKPMKYKLNKDILEHTRGMSYSQEWTYFNARLCEELELEAERRMAEHDNKAAEERDEP
jgi:hypothetical protein